MNHIVSMYNQDNENQFRTLSVASQKLLEKQQQLGLRSFLVGEKVVDVFFSSNWTKIYQ